MGLLKESFSLCYLVVLKYQYCVFYEQNSTYYILDMLCWKGYSLYDCETDFRFYWKLTKLDEVDVKQESERNPFKFLPLPYNECTKEGFSQCVSTTFPFVVEILFFYNKETHYTLGATPLLCSLEIKNPQNVEWVQRILDGDESVGMNLADQ